jgi:hypothetical protein
MCNGVQVITTPNQASMRQVVPPLYFTAFPMGYEVSSDLPSSEIEMSLMRIENFSKLFSQPMTMRLPTDDISQRFTWNADYPVVSLFNLQV